jgi:hypothetical protein
MAKDPTTFGRKSTAKRSSKSAGKRSAKRSSKRSASTESTKTSREEGGAKTAAAANAPATVRLRLNRSVSRGGRVFGPGEVDVPAALAESLKLNGAQEV